MVGTDGAERLADRGLGRIAAGLFVASFATFSLLYCVQPLLPELARDYRVDAATSSLALSATTAALALSILGMGAVPEAWPRRSLMFASLCAAALLNLAAAAAPTWEWLLAARTLEGLALGGVPGTAMAYLAEEIPPERLGLAMGLNVSGAAFGGMTGRVAMGLATEASSWRSAVGALSALDLAAAVVFFLLLPASRARAGRSEPRLHLRAWTGHLARPSMALLFLVGFLAMGAFVAVYNYIGFRLAEAPYRLSQGSIGLVFLCYLVGMAASSWAGGLADRFGRARVLMLGALVNLAGLALTLAEPLWLVILGVAALTAGFFMAHAVASGWVARLAAQNRSHAASLYLLAYYAGGSVLGAAVGWAWRAGGWSAVAAACAAAVAAILTIGLALSRTSDAV